MFYQLSYMAATSSAGIPRSKIFELARQVRAAPAKFFTAIDQLTDKMRLSYPDACRMVGERVKNELVRSFLFRLADALRSGEPLAAFLVREAEVQGENYAAEYQRSLESVKKWTDGYTSVMVSVALIVIINMVSTMIYDLGATTMAAMTFTAIVIGFIVAWVLSRAVPQETYCVPWGQGSNQQKLGLKLLKILPPVALIAAAALLALHVDLGYVFIAVALSLLPLGIMTMRAEAQVEKKDGEVSAFFRSLGGTASSRGTTLGMALGEMQLDSFPTLRPDIERLALRLRAGARPGICWQRFGIETGSLLIQQTSDIFYQATNLGGDPEHTGVLCSMFSQRIATLRAYRKGIAATFVWLALVMYGVLSALLIFILQILKRFISLMEQALTFDQQEQAMRDMAMRVLAFNVPQTDFLEQMTVALIVLMALTNAFALVATEGSHLAKMTFYLSIMLFLAGVAYVVVPSVVSSIL